MTRDFSRGAIVLLVAVTLTACTTPPVWRQEAVSEPAPLKPTPRPVEPPAVAGIPALPTAAKGLVSRAEQASAVGQHEEAVAQLERALRIAPEHPVLWQNLAVVRYRLGDYRQAEALALKSNSLANGFSNLKRSNWQLIAVSRRLRGDSKGAAAAEVEARRLGEQG